MEDEIIFHLRGVIKNGGNISDSKRAELLALGKIETFKLWKKLIDKKMTRTDLKEKSGISTVSLAKLGKNENLTTAVLVKICNALDCDISEIMEVVPENDELVNPSRSAAET